MRVPRVLLMWSAPVIGTAIMVLVWEVVHLVFAPSWLPSPLAVWDELWQLEDTGEILAASGRTLAVGLLVLFALATALTALMAMWRTMREALLPILAAELAAPKVALIPVFTLIWGFTTTTRIVTMLAYALSAVVVTWVAALGDRRTDLVDMARSFGAGGLSMVRTVLIPSAAPGLVAGARLGVLQSIKGLVTAEVLIAVVGVGKMLKSAVASFQIARVYAVVCLILAVSVVAYVLLHAVETAIARRTLGPES